MTDIELTTLSTLCWLVATVALFILLADWSAGASWGLTASIVRGVRGWADRDAPAAAATSPHVEALGPVLDPYAFVRRDRGPAESVVATARPADVPAVEVIDLGEHRLP